MIEPGQQNAGGELPASRLDAAILSVVCLDNTVAESAPALLLVAGLSAALRRWR